jgi:integrase
VKAAGRGLGGVYQRGGVWWIRYSYRGKKRRESCGRESTRACATRLLKKRLGEMGRGRLVGPDAERLTLANLRVMLLDDYRLKGNRTSVRATQCMAHVIGHFGENMRALDITTDRLTSYAKARQEEGAAQASVKYELAVLKRALNLAVRAERLPQRPAFPDIEVRNRRTGFFEEGEFRSVVAQLPRDVAALAEFMYLTGWRTGEALSLEWRNVDLDAGIIRIEDSKNREARTLPFRALPALEAVVETQRERTSAIEQAKGIIIPAVFHRDGQPIRDFRRSWLTACRMAGVPGRLVHDFRRTSARNLSRAGVPERVIMALCGWKTRSVFDRYRIVNETDLAEGLAKLSTLGSTVKPSSPKVVHLKTGTIGAQNQPWSEAEGL